MHTFRQGGVHGAGGRAPHLWARSGRAGAAGRPARGPQPAARDRNLHRGARRGRTSARAGASVGDRRRAAAGVRHELQGAVRYPAGTRAAAGGGAARARSRALAQRGGGADAAAEHARDGDVPRAADAGRKEADGRECCGAGDRRAGRVRREGAAGHPRLGAGGCARAGDRQWRSVDRRRSSGGADRARRAGRCDRNRLPRQHAADQRAGTAAAGIHRQVRRSRGRASVLDRRGSDGAGAALPG